MICEACWSSCSLVSKEVLLDQRLLVGVTGLEVNVESSDVEELDRLNGSPAPPTGVCVDEAEGTTGDAFTTSGCVYDSSWPSWGVGKPPEGLLILFSLSLSLYLPIQLRLRGGFSGLGPDDMVARATPGWLREGEERRKQGWQAHLFVTGLPGKSLWESRGK